MTELNNEELATTKSDLKVLKEAVQEGVTTTMKMDMLKEHLSGVIEVAADKCEYYDKAKISKIIALASAEAKDPMKANQVRGKIEDAYGTLDAINE